MSRDLPPLRGQQGSVLKDLILTLQEVVSCALEAKMSKDLPHHRLQQEAVKQVEL